MVTIHTGKTEVKVSSPLHEIVSPSLNPGILVPYWKGHDHVYSHYGDDRKSYCRCYRDIHTLLLSPPEVLTLQRFLVRLFLGPAAYGR